MCNHMIIYPIRTHEILTVWPDLSPDPEKLTRPQWCRLFLTWDTGAQGVYDSSGRQETRLRLVVRVMGTSDVLFSLKTSSTLQERQLT